MSANKTLVLCLARPDLGTVTGYLAALAAGNAVMLLEGGAAPEFVADVLRRYRPGFLVDGDRVERLNGSDDLVHPDLAVMLSTSGSTGSPRFVRIGSAALDANATQIVDYLGLGPAERAVQSLPLHYSYGLSVLNSHLLAQASVVLAGADLLSKKFWDAVRDNACTSFAGVPYAYAILDRIGFEHLDLPALTTLTQAGGRMPPETVLRFARVMQKRGGRLFVMYGQTEATARMAYLPPERALDKPDRIGVPVPGGALSLSEDGELVYAGPNVMLGYAESRADLARGDDLRGRLHTGDLGRVDDEGLFSVVGRKSRLAKLCGQRINLDELESRIAEWGPVAAIELTEHLVVAHVPREHPGQPLTDLRAHLRDLLRIPARFIRVHEVEWIPTTSSGKTNYARLEDVLRADDQ
ncbi:AMP-binding protein [Streptomyces xiamenensis]|uniref:AMP-binding protein n=1 Tax=Streptomyces xiamenensis TaxID=408015 RepID=UPI0036E445AD